MTVRTRGGRGNIQIEVENPGSKLVWVIKGVRAGVGET